MRAGKNHLAVRSGLMAWVLMLAVALGGGFKAHGQTTGTISGTVTDAGGALVPNVQVSAKNTATGELRTAVTNKAGEYSFPALRPGDYQIKFEATGFNAQVETATLNVTDSIAVNSTLQVGDVSLTVNVSSQQPMLNTDSMTLGDTISGTSVEQLPLATNNFTQLLALSPGVVGSINDSTGLGRGTQNLNVNGARTNSNSVYIDGVDAVNVHVSGLSANTFGSNGVVIPPIDDIQEIKIQTALFDASTGRSGGSNTFVLTKSGANQIHGSIYEYFRNTIFNSNSFFLKRNGVARPELLQNQFGGTVSGPIIKDKLFAFFGYQGTRQRNGYAGRTTVPMPYIPADRSAASFGAYYSNPSNFQTGTCASSYNGPCITPNGSNISPVALSLLNLKFPNGQYVIPTATNGTYSNNASYAASNVSTFNEDEYIGGANYDVSKKDRLAFNTIIAEQPQYYATASTRYLPGFGVNQHFKSRLYSTEETHIFSSNLVNDFHFGLNRTIGQTGQQTAIPLSSIGMSRFNSAQFPDIPLIELSGSFEIGYSGNADQADTENTWQYFDNLTWLKGKHNMIFGAEMRRYQDNYYSNNEFRGQMDILSFQNFLLGASGAPIAQGGNGTGHSDLYTTSVASGIVQRDDRIRDVALFVSDNWKPAPRVTIIAGLRYDYLGLPVDLDGRNGSFDPRRYVAPPAGQTTSLGFVQEGNARNPFPGIAKVSNTLTDNVNHLNFAPRIGVSVQIDSRQVLRGGYGLFYDRLSNQLGLQESLAFPDYERSTQINTTKGTQYNLTASLANPFTVLPLQSQFPVQPLLYSPSNAVAPPPISLFAVDPKLRTPYYEQWSLQLQTQISSGLAFELGYVGGSGKHLPQQTELDQAQIASPTNPVNGVTTNNSGVAGVLDTAADRAPYLGFTNNGLFYNQTIESSNFNSLQATLLERLGKAQITATYMYSKSLDTGSGTTDGSVFNTNSGDQTNQAQAYGPSDFNRTNRATIRLVQPIPSPRFHFAGTAAGRRIFGGYEFSAIGVIQSGSPYEIDNSGGAAYYGTDTSRGSYAPGISNSGAAVRGGSTESRLGTLGLQTYFNTADFVTAGNFYGNVARNSLVGPIQRNLDLSLTKLTKVTERVDAEFRAQAFNVTNTPNFANPGSDVGTTSTFGVISATTGNPRILQFVLKATF